MHIFSKDIGLSKLNDHTYNINISDNWMINNTPNGGYIMATLINAMTKHTDKLATPNLTTNFIGKCNPGPAEVKVEIFSKSKQIDRIQASIYQDKNEKIRAIGTFFTESSNDFIRYESSPPIVPPRDKCTLIPVIPNYSLYNNVSIYADPSTVTWFTGKLTDSSEHRGWIRFKDKRDHDLAAVALFTDAFPPPVLASQGMVAWVPTVEFSLNIRSLPVSEWCLGVFRTRFISNGMCDEDGELWDEEGNLVAISRQISLFSKS